MLPSAFQHELPILGEAEVENVCGRDYRLLLIAPAELNRAKFHLKLANTATAASVASNGRCANEIPDQPIIGTDTSRRSAVLLLKLTALLLGPVPLPYRSALNTKKTRQFSVFCAM